MSYNSYCGKSTSLTFCHQFIDFWMLFCLTIPVLEIVLHTVEDHFIRKYAFHLILMMIMSILVRKNILHAVESNFKQRCYIISRKDQDDVNIYSDARK